VCSIFAQNPAYVGDPVGMPKCIRLFRHVSHCSFNEGKIQQRCLQYIHTSTSPCSFIRYYPSFPAPPTEPASSAHSLQAGRMNRGISSGSPIPDMSKRYNPSRRASVPPSHSLLSSTHSLCTPHIFARPHTSSKALIAHTSGGCTACNHPHASTPLLLGTDPVVE
jgi:hypothetical protein